MHAFATTFVALSTLYASVSAAGTADALSLAIVKQQFVQAKITPSAVPVFSPSALLHLNFGGSYTNVTTGTAIPKDDVAAQPTVHVVGASSSNKYTIMMIDTDYVGSTAPNGFNLHWLQNNVAIAESNNLANGTSAATIPYAGPGPASGSGPHRYTVLVYQQPSTFTAPSTPAANSGVHLFNLTQYTSAAGLQNPVAGSYFTVEVGTATVTVESTSAVNPATLNVAGSSSTASLATTTKASSTAGGSPSASATHKSSASAVVGGSGKGLGAVVVAMVGSLTLGALALL